MNTRRFHQKHDRHRRRVFNGVQRSFEVVNFLKQFHGVVILVVIVVEITADVCIDEDHTNLSSLKLLAVLFHFHNRGFAFRGHTQQIDVFFYIVLTDGRRKEDKECKHHQNALVVFDGDINENIEGFQWRMLWFLQIKDQREVWNHKHGQNVNDNDANRKGNANGLNRSHGREHQRNEADDRRYS